MLELPFCSLHIWGCTHWQSLINKYFLNQMISLRIAWRFGFLFVNLHPCSAMHAHLYLHPSCAPTWSWWTWSTRHPSATSCGWYSCSCLTLRRRPRNVRHYLTRLSVTFGTEIFRIYSSVLKDGTFAPLASCSRQIRSKPSPNSLT